MEKEIFRVKPIVIYPKCILEKGIQSDCHLCDEKDECITYQPRSMCIRPYKNHKNGCPNFGNNPTCPPNMPCMYDQIFDTSDVYAIVTKFCLNEFFDKRRERRPDLNEGQIRNLRIWQPIALKENDYAISEFYKENSDMADYVTTRFLECMGVDVVNTMKEVGIDIKFPVEDYAYRVAFAAKVYDDALDRFGFKVYEETKGLKKGMRTLVKDNKTYKLIDENGVEYQSNIPGTIGGNRRLKIYGKLDCRSAKKWIEKGYYVQDRVFFKDSDTAIKAGYRPCGICMREEYEEWKRDKEGYSKKLMKK